MVFVSFLLPRHGQLLNGGTGLPESVICVRAALEPVKQPLCLTLGLLSGKRTENEIKNNTGAPAEAAERTDDKEKNPHA